MARLEGNIKKNYLFVFLSGTSLSEAIWMLFLAFRGMSLVQIGFLESIFHITSMLMEVPTGIIADRFGRKTSRALGRIMAMLGTLLMIVSRDFWLFACAFVFTALSYNLESGAGDALVYDSLLQCGKSDDYIKVKGRQEIAYQAAKMVSLIGSGIIASFDYMLAYVLTLGIHGVSFALSLSFEEPSTGGAQTPRALSPNTEPLPPGALSLETAGLSSAPADCPETSDCAEKRSFIAYIVQSFRVLKENWKIAAYILFVESFGIFYTTLYFYFQNFLKAEGYTEWKIGMVLAVSALAGMMAGANTHRIERALGERRLISISPFAGLLAFALIAFSGLEVLGIIILAAVEGLLFVSFSAYINRLIPSAQRATLLSFQSMAFSVMMAGFFPVIGWISERWGFKLAFFAIFSSSVPILLISRGLLLRKMEGNPRISP